MSPSDLEKLNNRIDRAKPRGEDDWGSHRQITAENVAFRFAENRGMDVTSFETSKEGTDVMLERLARMAVKSHHCKRCFWVGDEADAADSEQRVVIKGRAQTLHGKMCPNCSSPIDPTFPKVSA